MRDNFENDIENCLKTLTAGGLILYPTDTIWGIGCDATNDKAVEKIFSLKHRPETKSMILLVADKKDIYRYVEHPDTKLFEHLSSTENPTTVIYEQAKNIAKNLVSNDRTIAIRIVKDEFCKQLLSSFRKPIVSTSANISGEEFPAHFNEISPAIKKGVDYIVQHRQNDKMNSFPSSIIKLTGGRIEIIRS